MIVSLWQISGNTTIRSMHNKYFNTFDMWSILSLKMYWFIPFDIVKTYFLQPYVRVCACVYTHMPLVFILGNEDTNLGVSYNPDA